jgi:hypothetical protein
MRLLARVATASFVISALISFGIGGLVAHAGATQTGPTYYVNAASDNVVDGVPTFATDCAVSTNTDCGIDDAINAFDNDPVSGDADTINFSSSVSTFTVTNPATIESTDGTPGVSLSIVGNGQVATTVSGNDENTVFAVNGAHVSISGLTITDGDGSASNYGGGAVTVAPFSGPVILNDDTISNNTIDGGAGGGVYVGLDSATSMTNDTFFNNTAPDGGLGGAVFIGEDTGLVTMSNDTLLDNTATSDGGVYDGGGNVAMTNDTLLESEVGGNGDTTVANSILDGPTSCSGSITDGGYNVESDDSCGLGSSSVVASNSIGLATSLADNGSSGPETLSIDQSSSAFNEVPVGSCTITTDERGVTRPGISGANCDAGAYELRPISATLQLSGSPITGDNVYTASLTVPADSPAPNGSVVITDNASNSCSAPLTLNTATSYSGSCAIDGEMEADTVTATYNATLGDPFYSAATSNALTVQSAPGSGSGSGSGAGAGSTAASQATQAIAFPALADRRWGTAPFGIKATATSGLGVSFTSETPEVCSLSGSTVSILSAGTCTVVASQDGDVQFQAAASIPNSFRVTPVAPGIPTIRVATRPKGRLSISLTHAVSTGGGAVSTYQYSIDGRSWKKTAETSGVFVIAGLPSGATYSVRLRAVNVAGPGRPSRAVRIRVV